jgi:cytoskeletal protein CcmA (bactofilin family)
MEQATIGRSVVIKGDISGAEALFIDGRVEGSIHLADNRVTIGRNGVVKANIDAKEVVIMGEVTGNVECTDRLDIRSEGSLTGDVVTRRISVEDGAVMKGSVQVKAAEQKSEKNKSESSFKSSTSESFTEKPAVALAAAASSGSTSSSQSMYPGSN